MTNWRQFWRRLRRRNGWSRRNRRSRSSRSSPSPEIRFIEVPKPEAADLGEQSHRSLFPVAPLPTEPLPGKRLSEARPTVLRPNIGRQPGKLDGQELRGGESRLESLQALVAALGVRPADPAEGEAYLRAWLELSSRQKQVVGLVCAGHSNREIAKRLHLSPNTVKGHISLAMRRFGVRSRTELRVALAGWDFSRLIDFPKPDR